MGLVVGIGWLLADLGVGVRNGLGLDLGRVLVLVLHLVLGNGLHRHWRMLVHVEGWQGGSVGDPGVGGCRTRLGLD